MNEQQNEELYMILGRLIQAYTKGETSQVSVEIADRIFQSVEYCISLYHENEKKLYEKESKLSANQDIHACDQSPETSNKSEQISMISAYEKGYLLGEECAQQTKKLWIKVKNSSVNVDNNSYRETIWNGTGQFFDRYSLRFAANEIPKELTYPLANKVTGVSGIIYVKEYLTSLLLENQFMAKFDVNEIRALLAGMDAQAPDLCFNLSEAILTNAIAHQLLGNPCTTLDLASEEQTKLKDLITSLTIAQLQERLELAANQLLTEINLASEEMNAYVQAVLKRLSYQWSKEIRTGLTAKRFVSLNSEGETRSLKLTGSMMSESEWIECNFSLNQADSVKERVRIIAEHVHHIDDLIRCFDHFAGEEYYTLFAMLNQSEKEQLLAMVTKHLEEVEDEGLLDGWEQAMLEYEQKTKN